MSNVWFLRHCNMANMAQNRYNLTIEAVTTSNAGKKNNSGGIVKKGSCWTSVLHVYSDDHRMADDHRTVLLNELQKWAWIPMKSDDPSPDKGQRDTLTIDQPTCHLLHQAPVTMEWSPLHVSRPCQRPRTGSGSNTRAPHRTRPRKRRGLWISSL